MTGAAALPDKDRKHWAGLLRQRNFRLLWAGESVSGLGDTMAGVAMPLVAVSVLHASALGVSALTAATYMPYLILGLPAGAWVDRLPLRLSDRSPHCCATPGRSRYRLAAWLASAAVASTIPGHAGRPRSGRT